mmetsp:Transcript_21586/g.74085  ORF Transcript_21586/g.74085 Transcript_21586/m.74085 type:complete len:215 (-) Transcript_21586:139-783(-)
MQKPLRGDGAEVGIDEAIFSQTLVAGALVSDLPRRALGIRAAESATRFLAEYQWNALKVGALARPALANLLEHHRLAAEPGGAEEVSGPALQAHGLLAAGPGRVRGLHSVAREAVPREVGGALRPLQLPPADAEAGDGARGGGDLRGTAGVRELAEPCRGPVCKASAGSVPSALLLAVCQGQLVSRTIKQWLVLEVFKIAARVCSCQRLQFGER